MINVLPIKEQTEIISFCEKFDIPNKENRGVTVASDGNEILGYCAYFLNSESITITHLFPENDIMLADGILRSALHIADFKGIKNAFYSDTVSFDLLKRLDFINDETDMTLKIDKLHESCCSCGK